MNYGRVGVVMGGSSSERDISLRSGAAVVEALEGAGHDVHPVELVEDGDHFRTLAGAGIDVAFLALHGRLGEDGCIQGLLELLGIPYTGSGVLASALAMDKLKSKEMFRLHNVPTPPYYSLTSVQACASLVEAHGSFGFPAVVKPRREGSSIGVAKVDDLNALRRAVDEALEFDDSVIVERFIKGREVAVGILDGRVLGAIEVAPAGDMFDFRAKYESDTTEYFMPARLPATRYRGVLNLAERAVQALDVSGAARVDLLVTEGQNEYVLEVNTLPGMTATSLLPRIAASAGYGFTELCEAMLASARLATTAAALRPAVALEITPELDFDDLGEVAVAARAAQGAVAAQRSRTA